MSYDDKPSPNTPDSLDDAFFANAPADGLSRQDAPAERNDEPPVVARTDGASEASAPTDEVNRAHDLEPDFDEDAVLGRKRGLHVGAFFLVFGCAIAGLVVGYRVFRGEPPKESTHVAASASASAKVLGAPTISASASVAVASADSSAKANKPAASVAQAPVKSASGGTGSNLGAGPSGIGGPSDPVLAKGDLTAGEISGVVERNRPLVRRRCWQPAVDASQGMGGSARVQASFTIGPSGAVQSASASGSESDYPGLASCIAARIREWKFPPSASATPVNVPFVFAAQ